MYTRSVKNETFPDASASKSWIFDVGIGTKFAIEFKYKINANAISPTDTTKQVTLRASVSNIQNTLSYSSLATAIISTNSASTEKSIIIAQPDGSVGKYLKISVECGAIGTHAVTNFLEIYLTTY